MTDGLWPWTDWQQGARWDEWTWPRGLAAVALVLSSGVGSFLLAAASIAPCLFGPKCTYAALPQLWAAAVVLLLGPLVVFAFRRRVVWALTPPALLAGLPSSCSLASGPTRPLELAVSWGQKEVRVGERPVEQCLSPAPTRTGESGVVLEIARLLRKGRIRLDRELPGWRLGYSMPCSRA